MSIKTTELSVYYYKVTPKATTKDDYKLYQDELTVAFQFPELNKEYENVLQTNGEVGLFSEIKKRNNLIFGTFSYTQTENIPPSQNKTTKKIKTLELDDDDGLGYQTSFLFDSRTNIIAIVNRRPGVNANSIAHFVKHNYNTPFFSLEKVTTVSSMDNFFKTSSYKNLKITLAAPTDISSFIDKSDLIPMEIASLANKFEAGKLTFEMEANTKQSLNINTVRNVVSFFDKNLFSNVKKLTVRGDDPDVEEKTFDFISGRINDKITVEKTRHNNFRTREVYEQLEAAFNENSLYLRENFSNIND